jgi:hypothetical protein
MKTLSMLTLIALTAACATSQTPPPRVPAALQAPSGQSLALHTFASGVQIYTCSPRADDATRFEWTFKAPEADLFDRSGKRVGKHYAGPTWESNDGSRAVGALVARDDGPDATAIPWLLLKSKSNAGAGVFTQTQSIQRVNTVGGKAPASGCDQAAVGKEARVPYTADYFFYGPAGY